MLVLTVEGVAHFWVLFIPDASILRTRVCVLCHNFDWPWSWQQPVGNVQICMKSCIKLSLSRRPCKQLSVAVSQGAQPIEQVGKSDQCSGFPWEMFFNHQTAKTIRLLTV